MATPQLPIACLLGILVSLSTDGDYVTSHKAGEKQGVESCLNKYRRMCRNTIVVFFFSSISFFLRFPFSSYFLYPYVSSRLRLPFFHKFTKVETGMHVHNVFFK
ncbi:hypothetical protein DFH27DRAFT_302209 [Peziza echinospora]|nr:hypothetical protein DFH27DRAFT_302209 [Peziza echinospora]